MIAMYCRDRHAAPRTRGGVGARPDGRSGAPPGASSADGGLCADCAELLAYARARLEKCRYGAEKPTCAKCTTHCYKPAMRERVRAVMRYSGPRMLKEHPVLAVAHLADGRKTPGA